MDPPKVLLHKKDGVNLESHPTIKTGLKRKRGSWEDDEVVGDEEQDLYLDVVFEVRPEEEDAVIEEIAEDPEEQSDFEEWISDFEEAPPIDSSDEDLDQTRRCQGVMLCQMLSVLVDFSLGVIALFVLIAYSP